MAGGKLRGHKFHRLRRVNGRFLTAESAESTEILSLLGVPSEAGSATLAKFTPKASFCSAVGGPSAQMLTSSSGALFDLTG